MSIVEPIRDKSDLLRIEKYLLQKNYRDYTMFKLGINCGLRISDILALNVVDVYDMDMLKILEKKTNKRRNIPLNSTIKNILKHYVKSKRIGEPLFSSVNGNRLERTSVYRIIKESCFVCGIRGNIGTHTLRKTFGYHFYKKYKNIALLQKILNHSHPSVTLKYIGISDDEIYASYKDFKL